MSRISLLTTCRKWLAAMAAEDGESKMEQAEKSIVLSGIDRQVPVRYAGIGIADLQGFPRIFNKTRPEEKPCHLSTRKTS